MIKQIFDLKKEAHLLSGAERAKLVIKDDYQKTYGNRKGFLDELEKQALLCMSDHQIKEEYQSFWKTYERMPLTVADVSMAYLNFKYCYEALKKAHLLLNISTALDCLSKLIKENIANEDAKRDAIKIVDAIQALKTDPVGKPAFKETLNFVKWIASKASKRAQDFASMKKTVDSVNEMMGFNIFYEHYSERCQIFAEEISLCIKEHNRIIKRFGEGMLDLNGYLISELTSESDCDEQ